MLPRRSDLRVPAEAEPGEALARPINDFVVVLQMPLDVQRAEADDDKAKPTR